MVKIYFDNVLIDTDSYTQIDNEYKLFTDNFKLGSVACNVFYLGIMKSAVSSQPEEVRIEDTETSMTWHFIVDSVTENDDVYVYTLVDKLMNFNFDYDASVLINTKAELEEDCYLSDIWHDMCDKAGVEYDETYEFENDIVVNWYDSRIKARRYLSFIAELQSGYACMLENGKQSFKKFNKLSAKTIDADECSDLIIGEKKKITRVVYDGGTFKYEFGDDTGDTLYLQSDNVYIVNETIVENIYNNIKDFEFYIIEAPNAPMDSTLRAGDIITFVDGEKEYPTIAQYSMSYYGGWSGKYYLKVDTKKQQETQITRTSQQVRNIQTKVDRLNNEFSVIAEEIEKLTDYIRNVGNTGDNIKLPNTPRSSGAINTLSIKGFSLMPKYKGMQYKSKTSYKGVLNFYTLIFSNELVTYTPILPTANEEYEGKLFNEGGLKGKYWRCVYNEDTEEYEWLKEEQASVKEIYVNSPVPLNKVGDIYDEILIDANKIKIIQRIGYDFDNEQWSVLSNPVTHELNDVLLPTFEDDTYISVKYFDNLTFNAEYLIKNDLTSNFATQLESSSQFKLNQNEIEAKVNKDGIISSINLSPEEAKIDSNKITLTAKDVLNLLAGKELNLKSQKMSIVSDNLLIKDDGQATFKINGKEIFNESGVLSNLQYEFKNYSWYMPNGSDITNGYWFLGYNTEFYSETGNWKNYIMADVYIPENFTVVEAKITLFHANVRWDNGSAQSWGYCRNLRAYKVINADNFNIYSTYASEYMQGITWSKNEISNAFGSNGFTSPITSGFGLSITQSQDIKSSLTAGNNKIIVQTSNTPTSSILSPNDAITNLGGHTGYVYALINITGYMKI